jgi:hypothetical protein
VNASDCVLCWLLLLEEYGFTFDYLPGKKNVVAIANTLFCLDIEDAEEVLTLPSGSKTTASVISN